MPRAPVLPLTMIHGFRRSWRYTKMSLWVLNRCSPLLVFPILLDLFLVLFVGGFLVWIHTTQGFEAWLATCEVGEQEAGV